MIKMSTATSIGTAFRRERKRQGLSQGHIAELSGLSKARLSRYENGHVLPTIDTLAKMCDPMNLRVSDLLKKAGW